MWVIYCANIYQRTFRNIHLLRKCMAASTPQGVGADSSRPFFNPNQMVLIWRNDANCNAIWWNYVDVVRGIAISTVGIRNAILWVFVGTGTINRPLRLRGERGKTWVNVAINNKMGNAKYINEHSVISIYCANVW